MSEIIDLYNLLSDKTPGAIGINLFLTVMVFWVLKEKKIFRHPRYFIRYLTFAFLLIIFFNFTILGIIDSKDVATMVFISSLFLLYIIVSFVAVHKPIGLAKIKLKKLEMAVERGLSWDRESLFLKKPLYIINFAEIFKYNLIHAKHLIALDDFKGAYEVYSSIDEKKLFLKEKHLLLQKKADVLFTLGDITRAKYTIDFLKDSDNPNYSILTAMIYEISGQLDKAAEYLQIALNSVPTKNEGLLEANIYNYYGRLRFLEGNLIDAINYYRLSTNIAKRHKNKEIIHVSYQNLIHLYLLQGEYKSSENYLLEYESLIDINLINDARELYNLKIEIARQRPYEMNLNETIMDGYLNIRERLEKKKQILFDISVLRMAFNANMDFEIIMEKVFLNQEKYFALGTTEKYFALKEVNIVLREVCSSMPKKYKLLENRISHYMEINALNEIESYISTLKNYEINERCQLERERVIILKKYVRPYNFQVIYNHLLSIKDIFRKNGMVIDALTTDLDISNECYAIENIIEGRIKELPLAKMKEHVSYAAETISQLNRHPVVNVCNLRIAFCYFYLNEKEKAKQHYEAFESSGVSIKNYAYWLQHEYEVLKIHLDNHKSSR